MLSPLLQVQNQLNAFIVLAAVLWCVLGAVTMILQEHSTQAVVVSLWYAPTHFMAPLLAYFNALHPPSCMQCRMCSCGCSLPKRGAGTMSVPLNDAHWHAGVGLSVSLKCCSWLHPCQGY